MSNSRNFDVFVNMPSSSKMSIGLLVSSGPQYAVQLATLSRSIISFFIRVKSFVQMARWIFLALQRLQQTRLISFSVPVLAGSDSMTYMSGFHLPSLKTGGFGAFTFLTAGFLAAGAFLTLGAEVLRAFGFGFSTI